MTHGALIFAHNNTQVDYIKLAVFAAARINKFLNIPVSLVTDSPEWLASAYPNHTFDQVIETTNQSGNTKQFFDGSLYSKSVEWKNLTRYQAYDLTPYDKTLVIDSDYVINSPVLKTAFDRDIDFQIYQKSFDLAGWRDTSQFERINPYSVPFYWATAFVFQKSTYTRAFFDLLTYIKINWVYFKSLYSIEGSVYRNDYAFSIAIHIMNGKTNGGFATELPGTMSYIIDRDLLVGMKDTGMQFLLEKKDHLGEYTLAKTTSLDVHVMNKMSLSRIIDEVANV